MGYTESDGSVVWRRSSCHKQTSEEYFDEEELDVKVVVSKMEITTQHGAIEGKTQRSETAFYSLNVIIAVGYCVSSARATKFRIWATKILNEYIRKGFVLDDDRLKQGIAVFGKNYFVGYLRGFAAFVPANDASGSRSQTFMPNVRMTMTAIRPRPETTCQKKKSISWNKP